MQTNILKFEGKEIPNDVESQYKQLTKYCEEKNYQLDPCSNFHCHGRSCDNCVLYTPRLNPYDTDISPMPNYWQRLERFLNSDLMGALRL